MFARSLLAVSILSVAARIDAQYPAALQQGAPAPTTPAEAVVVLKTHYFSQDFAGGDAAGAELTKQFPTNAQVRAWHVVTMARVEGREKDALAIVDSTPLWPSKDRSVWRDYARAFVVGYQRNGTEEAAKLAAKVRARMPWDRDALWLYGYNLHRAGKYAQVVALADSAIKRQPTFGEIRVLKGNALGLLRSGPQGDTANGRKAKEAFAEARRVEPSNLNATYLPSVNLSEGSTDTLAFALLQRAKDMTPALSVHQAYWRAIRARRGLTTAQRDSIVTADIEELLRSRPHVPAVLKVAHDAFQAMDRPERAKALETKIRTEFANSAEAEGLDYGIMNALRDSIFTKKMADTAEGMARLKRMTTEFVARPKHKNSGIYGTVLLTHFINVIREDSTITADSLKKYGEKLVAFNPEGAFYTYGELPLLVAQRKGDFRWAEKLVRQGDSVRKAQIERAKDFFVREEGVGRYAEMLDAAKASTHSGLGWIYLQEGRLDEAAVELEKARELNRQDARTYFHLGKLAEARGKPSDALAMYARGFPYESSFSGRWNRDAIKASYVANHGSLDGFDAFVEKLKEEDRQRRKEKIASSWLTDTIGIPKFSLARFGTPGAKASNDDIKGKVAVVNFWGVWCGPCVKEIPDIQKIHETLKQDTAVVFLTVDYNDELETLRDFMAKKKLDFPVILDSADWVSKTAKITAFPTTWFVDRDGKLAFKHIGASDVVYEEFIWRVEMLKAGRPLKP